MQTAVMLQRAAVGNDPTAIDESQIHRDDRGLARWTKEGLSLLTPSDVDPGPRPVATAENYASWDDLNYAWELANERFRLPRDYVPPSLSSLTLAQPVTYDTSATVRANAIADRRAAGIVDSPSGATPSAAFLPSPTTIVPSVALAPAVSGMVSSGTLNADRVSTTLTPGRYLSNGVVTDETGKPQVLPTNNTVASPAQNHHVLWGLVAVAVILLVIAARRHRR